MMMIELEESMLKTQDERRMARFAQYAMVASEEALKDAGWAPTKEEELETTVCLIFYEKIFVLTQHQGVYIGSGIGSLDDAYDTAVAFDKGVSRVLKKDGRSLIICRVTKKYLRSLFHVSSSIWPQATYQCTMVSRYASSRRYHLHRLIAVGSEPRSYNSVHNGRTQYWRRLSHDSVRRR